MSTSGSVWSALAEPLRHPVPLSAFTEYLSTLQGASFVGLLIVTTFAGLQRGQVQNLKGSVEGLRGDRDDLETRLENRDRAHAEELAARDAIQAADRKRITDLEAEVSALRRTVTGEAHLTVIEGEIGDLLRAVATHHTEAMAGVGRLETAAGDQAAALRELAEAVRDQKEAS